MFFDAIKTLFFSGGNAAHVFTRWVKDVVAVSDTTTGTPFTSKLCGTAKCGQ